MRRRFMGHRAGEDVFGRIYTLDHPDVAPLAKVAAILDDNITTHIASLLTPTTRGIHWGTANPIFARADHVDAACWPRPAGRSNPATPTTHSATPNESPRSSASSRPPPGAG